MTSPTTGLPVHDVHLRILDYIVADCKIWEESRQYLPLRLLSTSLRDYFEKALFRRVGIAVTGDVSTWSANIGCLLCLLSSNSKLASYVKHLAIVDGRPGPPALRWGDAPIMDYPVAASDAKMDEAQAGLVKLCTKLEVLELETASIEEAVVPIFTEQTAQHHPDLRHVILRDGALSRHIVECHSTGLRNSCLTIVSGGRSDPGFEGPNFRRLAIQMAMFKANFPPLYLDTLVLVGTTSTDLDPVIWGFANIRPRHVVINRASYNGDMRSLYKLVYDLVNAQWARAAKEIRFKSRAGDAPGLEFLERFDKVKDAVAGRVVRYD